MSVLRWEEPPPVVHRGGGAAHRTPWAVIAAELRARPGEWGVVLEGDWDVCVPSRIEKGKSPWFRPTGSFEACQRSVNGIRTLYARYVGESS